MERFLKGDDEFKKSRLKMIANVVEGPWIVKAAVGKQAASILGRANLCRLGFRFDRSTGRKENLHSIFVD